MRYRKKPVEIEAYQVQDFEDFSDAPEWIFDAAGEGRIDVDPNQWEIPTLEGTMTVSLGDWIIQGVHGELYPCKPDIFEATYDEVTSTIFDTEEG